MMLGMGSTPTVLIVDDEPINIHLLAGILGSEYEIKVANSGKLALTVATQKPYPDLILLDVMMPEMDGFEVCELLKANPVTRHIPIIFITAAFTRLSEVKGLKLGAVDYITKPIDKDITRLRVRNHILLKLSEERLREHDALLNSMFDNAPTAILIIAKNGSPLLVNKTGLDLFGVDSLEQFRSVHLVQFIEPDFREAYQQMLTNTYQGQCCDQMDLSIVNQKGLRRWLRIKPSPLCDGEKRVIGTLFMISDVTGSRHAEVQLRLSARVFESTQEGILVTDVNGCIVSVNEAFSQITGYASEDVVGKNPKILKSNEHNSKFYKEMWDSIKASGQWQGEIWNRKKDGSLYPERLTISSIFDDQDQLTHYVGVFSDNTLIKQHEKELEHIAHYDILTGLPNRFLLDDRLQQAIAQSQREKTILAVCYLDLDSFKPINDKFGHETGDQVLIETANRLKKSVRNVDTVARLGGDEFVILLCKLADIKECLMTVERILGVLSTPMLIEKQHCQVSCSIGVTLFPEDNVTADILLRHADQAMYVAKQNGKNNYYFFNKDQERKILSLSKMMRQIEQALSSQEFELFYQPKIQIQSGALVGAEALIRWNHPQDGLLLPGQFLPFIRNSELELNLGDWVIQNAIQQICQWRNQGLELEVSVNISGVHLQHPDFTEQLKKRFANSPLWLSESFQIEILETTAFEDFGHVINVINICRDLGIRFALDDFGTGYSSLTYLRNLPTATIKIDQSFVRNMLTNKSDHAIVESIIGLSRTFQRETVAEGVETEAHLQILNRLGCDVAQGFGIARPMSASAFLAWHRSRS